ncbi:DICT sensory domain-containing protein [Halorubrum sp. N11]|uniref:DICT sensory domain-containing protein n=1 Tax=Halorubrum sp. N11 TaxID=3402276 RepID=UPI003EBADA69
MTDALRGFFDDIDAPSRSLVVVNRSEPEPIQNLLDSLLEGQSVGVSELDLPDADTDVVFLVEDGKVLARSTLDELTDSVLLINSDLYKTGTVDLDEVRLPDVLAGLDEVPFRLRGYPQSSKEKLLLIVVSRVIERFAAEAGGGTLRSSFQRLSRLQDEQGTRRVYDIVGNRGVDVHVYGVGDAELSSLPVTVHQGRSYPYRRSWFVVCNPPPEAGSDHHAALVALEDEPNVWDGFWTFRPALVDRIDRHVATSL